MPKLFNSLRNFFKRGKKNQATVTVQQPLDKKYKMLFKCTLCGKVFASDEDYAVQQMGVGDATHQMHFCENGDVGRLEFLGLRLKEKIPDNVSDITSETDEKKSEDNENEE